MPPAGKPDTSATSVDGEDERGTWPSGTSPERQRARGSEKDAGREARRLAWEIKMSEIT